MAYRGFPTSGPGRYRRMPAVSIGTKRESQ